MNLVTPFRSLRLAVGLMCMSAHASTPDAGNTSGVEPVAARWACHGDRWCEPGGRAPLDIVQVWTTEDGVQASTREATLQTTDGVSWSAIDGGIGKPTWPAGPVTRLPLLRSDPMFTFTNAGWTPPRLDDEPLGAFGFPDKMLRHSRLGLWMGSQRAVVHQDNKGAWTAWLPSDIITGLTIDGRDRVWVTGHAGLLAYFQNATWTAVSTPLTDLRDIAAAVDGTLYVLSDHQLGIRTPEGAWQIESVRGRSIALLPNGTLVVVTDAGTQFRQASGRWEQPPERAPGVDALGAASDGRVWVSSRKAPPHSGKMLTLSEWNGVTWTEDESLRRHVAKEIAVQNCARGLLPMAACKVRETLSRTPGSTSEAAVVAIIPADDGSLWLKLADVFPTLTLQRRAGTTWKTIVGPRGRVVEDLWTHGGEVWIASSPEEPAASPGRQVARFESGAWKTAWTQQAGEPSSVFAGDSKVGLFIAGEKGGLVRIGTHGRERLNVPVSEDVLDLAIGNDTVFALVDNGVWARPLSGGHWKQLVSAAGDSFVVKKRAESYWPGHLWLGRSGELWVSGVGEFFRWSGTDWETIRTPGKNFHVIAGIEHPDWVAGASGLLWSKSLTSRITPGDTGLPGQQSALVPTVFTTAPTDPARLPHSNGQFISCTDGSGLMWFDETTRDGHELHWLRQGEADRNLARADFSREGGSISCASAGVAVIVNRRVWFFPASGAPPRPLEVPDEPIGVMINSDVAIIFNRAATEFSAVSLSDGKRRWASKTVPGGAPRAIDSVRVIVQDTGVRAVSLADGASKDVGKSFDSAMTLERDRLYFWHQPERLADVTLISVSLTDGTRETYSHFPFREVPMLVVSDGHVGTFDEHQFTWFSNNTHSTLAADALFFDAGHVFTFDGKRLTVRPVFPGNH